VDFVRLAGLAACGAFFVTRAKDTLRFTRHRSLPANREEALRSDRLGTLTLAKAREAFPRPLRRVRHFDAESRRDLIFLSNHLEISALTVAPLYKLRWQVDLFFRWIKQPLRIKHFYGNNPNAVKAQIWIAVAVYVMVAILHKQLQLPGTLQILSVHPFEKVPLHELLTQTEPQSYVPLHSKQLMLWDL
jgi:Transposase DDE domain